MSNKALVIFTLGVLFLLVLSFMPGDYLVFAYAEDESDEPKEMDVKEEELDKDESAEAKPVEDLDKDELLDKISVGILYSSSAADEINIDSDENIIYGFESSDFGFIPYSIADRETSFEWNNDSWIIDGQEDVSDEVTSGITLGIKNDLEFLENIKEEIQNTYDLSDYGFVDELKIKDQIDDIHVISIKSKEKNNSNGEARIDEFYDRLVSLLADKLDGSGGEYDLLKDHRPGELLSSEESLENKVFVHKSERKGIKLEIDNNLDSPEEKIIEFKEKLNYKIDGNDIEAGAVVDHGKLNLIISGFTDKYLAESFLDRLKEDSDFTYFMERNELYPSIVDYTGYYYYPGSSFNLLTEEKIDMSNKSILVSSGSEDSPLELKNNERKYRGNLKLKTDERNRIMAINTVELEKYLKGVLPAEVFVSWEMDALKAQAVAARTYALYGRDRNMDRYEHFDVTDDTDSQVYAGYNVENSRTNEAVRETSGEVVLNNDKLINALYHSNAGGYTEDAENIWGSEIDYIRSRESSWDEIALEGNSYQAYEWEETRTRDELSERIDNLYDIGELIDIEILERTEAGRVLTVRYIGEEGEHEVHGDFNRTPLELRSTNFEIVEKSGNNNNNVKGEVYFMSSEENVVKKDSGQDVYVMTGENEEKLLTEDDYYINSKNGTEKLTSEGGTVEEFVFRGKGFGHGAGLSQWGAQGKALEGYDYKEILKHYYSGDIEIDKM
ncbi:SpoIID/LytB domain-containing protein [Natranaerofaba carboxydovora]|uniref:SpoIID/LytB domain-containing protein n=1 Tax=Natranaerofaba carboxydovora TaxID=2742683 RepID=UPI001F146AD0|nr:Amidase enhancer [Natranaerofaba carboxydovora]